MRYDIEEFDGDLAAACEHFTREHAGPADSEFALVEILVVPADNIGYGDIVGFRKQLEVDEAERKAAAIDAAERAQLAALKEKYDE